MNKPKLSFRSTVFDYSGYGTLSRNIILELYKTGQFDLAIEPLRWVNSGNIPLKKEDEEILRRLEDKSMTKEYFQDIPNRTLVHAVIAPEFQPQQSPYKKYFGLTMLETDQIPQFWVQKCNMVDGIIVPSHFCMASFMKSGVTKPIRTVPLGTDFEIFTPDGETLLSVEDISTPFNFMVVGQWTPQDRKNIGQTLKVFCETFKGRENIGLIMKVQGFGAGTLDKIETIERIWAIRKQAGLSPDENPKMYLIHGAMEQDEMAKLYRNCRVLILPSSGEAWGIPLLEAIASGLPVITTGGTGAETFLNPSYSILLNHKWNPIPQRMHWPGVYEAHQQITIPDWAEFARMLVRVYQKYEVAKENALKQRDEVIQRDFSWKKSAENLVSAIKDMGGIE